MAEEFQEERREVDRCWRGRDLRVFKGQRSKSRV